MIAAVDGPQRAKAYRAACENVPALGCLLRGQWEALGARGGFYTGPGLALDAGGDSVYACGRYDPEEMAAFLAFLGAKRLCGNGPCPAGWVKAGPLLCYGLAAGAALALGAPPAGFQLNRAPAPGPLADMLFAGRGARRDDFYTELCAKRNHGQAMVWALERAGEPVCTVGMYACDAEEAYMACGFTERALRGQGLGGWLIAALANELAAGGRRVTFLCQGERRHFYERLGFAQWAEYALYTPGTGPALAPPRQKTKR